MDAQGGSGVGRAVVRAGLWMIALVVLATACGGAEDGAKPGQLVVHARLTEQLEPGPWAIAERRCPIDGERRPAIGCTRWLKLAERTLAADVPATPVSVQLPRVNPPRPQMLQWSLRTPGTTVDVRRPATLAGAGQAAVQVDLAAVAGADRAPGTRMTLRARPTLAERVRTVPVHVPRNSTLELGLAIDTSMPHDDVEAVVFSLSAETATGERPLFESRVATNDPAAARWTDHRVALDAVAGGEVRFVFTTRLVARPGADASRVGALPLWGAPEILVPGDQRAPNVVLISFDTLRADHVGAYGSDLPTTPHLDRLAAEGVVFDDVFATYPATSASHMSMVTGLYPASHGVLVSEPLREHVPTLANLLGARGWRTGAVTENGMLRADAGFSRGMSFYRESTFIEDVGKESRLAASTFDAATRFIAAHTDERFFLFIHTYVVHWPYEPPPEYDLFQAPDGAAATTGRDPKLETFRRRYAGEARYGDALFGGLRDELARLGLANHTLIVVTSDHGDEFGEHGGWSHARTVYDEVMRVPLIFWAPQHLGTPRRVPGLASLVDVVPTILDVLDVSPPTRLDGRSLLADAPAKDRVVYGEIVLGGERRLMARTREGKWVWRYGNDAVVEAYDLIADPAERRSITDAAFHARGASFLAEYKKRAAAPVPAPSDAPTDPATAEKLRALGYVE